MTTQTPRRSGIWNPSYPQRVHLSERAHWEAVTATWKQRVDAAAAEAAHKPDAARAQRLLAQMQGACDQMADCAARMPLEAAELYHEDHHRMEQAIAAIERLFSAW